MNYPNYQAMKIANILLTLMFVAFAAFQYNDTDGQGLLWMALYALIAGIFAFAIFQKYSRPVVWVALGLCAIAALLTAHGVWEFATNHDGVGLAQGMSNEYPYIELTREFGGAIISVLSLLFVLRQIKKQQVALPVS
ncbi:MAG: hypothetical protein D6730_17070 [Bacteroidetes bacterium]|nr:MAG: hypothetical protein D6730_17070 [Bacteroidota bacterium]